MGRLSSKAVWGAALALWVMIPGPVAFASSGSGKLDKLLRESGSSGSAQSVIIRTRPGLKASVKERLTRRGKRTAEHKLIEALTARLDAREIKALASDPDILSVSADAVVTSSASGGKKQKRGGTSTSTGGSADTSAATGDATEISGLKASLGLADWFSGSSVTVAVIDSGIANSTDFSGRVVGFYDFTGGKPGVAGTPYDDYGHGTHVSGLIGSSGATSNGKYAGVAPGVKILSLKVLDKHGAGRTSEVIRAIEFAVANRAALNVKVINLSLGHPIFEPAATDPLVQAVEAAVRSGIVVVTAAGNFGTNPTTGMIGYGGVASPGNAPSAITVGAANTAGTLVRTDDRVTGYSSRGPSWYDGIAKPDVLAPGHSMVSNEVDSSTLAIEYPWLVVREGSTKYLRLNGSSMATGVVSGLAALMIEANNYAAYQRWQYAQSDLRKQQQGDYAAPPALSSNAIKAMLQYSATPIRDASGVQYDALTQGAGLVNGLGAIALSYFADTSQPVGSFWTAYSMPPSTPFGGVEQPWSQSLIWGTALVQGSSLMDIHQSAWSDNIVWGTGELDNIVWGTVSDDLEGDNLVWGTTFDGDNIVWGTSILGDVFWSGNALSGDNIVWGTNIDWADNIVWGTNLLGFFDGDNIVWGTMDTDNIVWGTLDDDNIVWGTSANKVTVLGTSIVGGVQ